MALSLDALIDELTGVKQWERRGERAPHKPLLLLLFLARLKRGEERLGRYIDTEPKLSQLLIDFGPPRKSVHPEHPFWRLQNDGAFWEIPERNRLIADISDRVKQGHIPPTVLRARDVCAGFSEEAYSLLQNNFDAVDRLVGQLLDENFPPSMHEDILDAIGMPLQQQTKRKARDPAFRDNVLRIYEYRCAICGYDGRLGNTVLGLEAAHIKWSAANGPDTPDNGVALCVFHHKALDRGAIGLNEDLTILISQEVHGSPIVVELLTRYAHEPLRKPQRGEPPPEPEYIQWHRKEVFREPARNAS